jgi:hypothetical protein
MSTSDLVLAIQDLFRAHQVRLLAVAAVHQAGGLSGSLRKISVLCLSTQIQTLVKEKYASDCAAGIDEKDKIERLATSSAALAKEIRSVAPNDAFYEAFITGSEAAAQEVFLAIFDLNLRS